MSPIVQTPLPPMAVTDIDQVAGGRSIAVDQAVAVWRQAVADCGYTMDALEASMEGKNRAYIHKVLAGEKPMSLAFIVQLPRDVKGRHAQLSAEAHGFIVVVPVRGEDAIRQLVGGLVGVLQGLKAA